MTNFDRAQAQYDAQTPREPEEHDFAADVSVTFWLHIDGLTFDVGSQDEQMKDWMRDELMPRLAGVIRQEIEPAGRDAARFLQRATYGYTTVSDPIVDSDYEIEAVNG